MSPLPNALHLSLFVVEQGLSTGRLPDGSEAVLNFGAEAVHFYAPDGEENVVFLDGHNQQSLLSALAEAIPAAQARLEPERLSDDSAFEINTALAGDYGRALYDVQSGFMRFRSRLLGAMTPLVIWPHHFDLSFVWFAGMDMDERSSPHFNFGFSPYTDDTLPRPYIYTYIYPLPEGMSNDDLILTPLPEPAKWHTDSWTGVVLPYDRLLSVGQPTTCDSEYT